MAPPSHVVALPLRSRIGAVLLSVALVHLCPIFAPLSELRWGKGTQARAQTPAPPLPSGVSSRVLLRLRFPPRGSGRKWRPPLPVWWGASETKAAQRGETSPAVHRADSQFSVSTVSCTFLYVRGSRWRVRAPRGVGRCC